MKILSFGYIPTWAGGGQSSGLANVIYQLAKNMSKCTDVEMSLASTDVSCPKTEYENLTIYGWTKSLLVKYILHNPIISVRWFNDVLKFKREYGPAISVPRFFLKGLHLSRVVSLVQPDAVHLHGMGACVYEHIIPKEIKIIVTMHGMTGDDINIPYHQYYYKMEKEVCRSERYSFIAFISSKLISDFSHLYGNIKSNSVTILNAYDSSSFHYIQPIEHNNLSLCTIASLSERKGQNRVIVAIAKSGISIKYICVGSASASKKEEYIKLAENLRVHLDYRGSQEPSRIRDILADADYMILPSSTEGFGLVYLEAIACGVPVILPKNLPIVQEKGIIQESVNAILLEDCSAEAIVKVLPRLKEQHFDRKKVSESVVNYTWRNIAQQYVDSIRDIL